MTRVQNTPAIPESTVLYKLTEATVQAFTHCLSRHVQRGPCGATREALRGSPDENSCSDWWAALLVHKEDGMRKAR